MKDFKIEDVDFTAEDVVHNVMEYVRGQIEDNFAGKSNITPQTLERIRLDGNEILECFGLPMEIGVCLDPSDMTKVNITLKDKNV